MFCRSLPRSGSRSFLCPFICRSGSIWDLVSTRSIYGRSGLDLEPTGSISGRSEVDLGTSGSISGQSGLDLGPVRQTAGRPTRQIHVPPIRVSTISILFLDNLYFASEKTHLRVHTEMPRSYSLLLGYDTLGYSDIFLVAFPAAILAQSTHIRATCSRLLS